MTDEMLVEAVAPCPFCGGDAASFVEHSKFPPGYCYGVECDKCDARTGEFDHKEEAITAWNRRALPPEMRAAGEMKRALASVYPEMKRSHDAGDGHFSTAQVKAAEAALALASSPGQQSTKDGEEE